MYSINHGIHICIFMRKGNRASFTTGDYELFDLTDNLLAEIVRLDEWNYPSPSFLDKQSWRDNLVADIPMVTIILGRKASWVARKEGNKIREMREVFLSE